MYCLVLVSQTFSSSNHVSVGDCGHNERYEAKNVLNIEMQC